VPAADCATPVRASIPPRASGLPATVADLSAEVIEHLTLHMSALLGMLCFNRHNGLSIKNRRAEAISIKGNKKRAR
jgi:hypothetical protein